MASIEATLNAAFEHHQHHRWQEAEALYRQVLASEPGNVDALQLLGVLAHQNGKHEAAVELLTQALRLRGPVPSLHNNLGEAYRMLDRYPEAIAAYQKAILLQSDFAEPHNNLGTVYQNQAEFEKALACYECAIRCQPDYANAHYNRARTLLTLGDFERGWREYEWRWNKEDFRRPTPIQPAWDGSPLAGRTLLVQAEQGLGDTIQFIRYVLILQRQGANVLAEVQSALIPLLSQSGIRGLIPQQRALPHFDVHAPLLSLPRLLKTTLDSIPAKIPYLSAEPRLIDYWQSKLDEHSGFKVGIFWQVAKNSPLPWRSFPLAAAEPLANLPGVCLVSLQKGFGTEQIPANAERVPVLDFANELDETSGPFMDTAALVSQLDLVISADSAVAHLAGALGVQAWILLPLAADWRWMHSRPDSPWYPTLRLFRQEKRGDWAGVFEKVAAALEALMNQEGAR